MLKKYMLVIFTIISTVILITLTYVNVESIFVDNEEKEQQIIQSRVLDYHTRCLATAIYHEANNESTIGQVAVARVVMNRIAHGFGPNPCNVVYQSRVVHKDDGTSTRVCQFSWACGKNISINEDNHRYKKALKIAQEVYFENKWRDLLPGNTLFFHNKSVSPGWKYVEVTTIGNHVFYSNKNLKM